MSKEKWARISYFIGGFLIALVLAYMFVQMFCQLH
jgi:hypothetical protein